MFSIYITAQMTLTSLTSQTCTITVSVDVSVWLKLAADPSSVSMPLRQERKQMKQGKLDKENCI